MGKGRLGIGGDAAYVLAAMTNVESPCVRLCAIDPADGLCAGCGRTLDEIVRWSTMSGAERRRIMALLPARRAHGAAGCTAGRDLPVTTEG